MNFMINCIFQIFSTREIAIFIWICIFITYILSHNNVRDSIIKVIKLLGHSYFIIRLSSLITYTLFCTSILQELSYWDTALIKDTIFWFLFTAISIFFSIHKAKDVTFFTTILNDNIKIIIAFDFFINLYTFPLLIELLLFPTIVLASISQATINKDSTFLKINSFVEKLLTTIVLFMVLFSIYQSITEYRSFFSTSTLKSFLLPIILTILSLPYFYILALFISYDSFIRIVKHLHRNENQKIAEELIKATIKYANINLTTLRRIWKYQVAFNASEDKPYEYIKKASKKPKYIIGDTAKLKAFNDIRKVIRSLSSNEIGKLDEWHKSYSGDDCYLSMTNYYEFGCGDITKIQNSLAYYLTGEETYIKQLDVVLNIGYQQDRKSACLKFRDVIKLTFDSLMVPLPPSLIENKILKKKITHVILILIL